METTDVLMDEEPAPGTVMTEEELQRWLSAEIRRNQERKKAQEEMAQNFHAGWDGVKRRFAETAGNSSYGEISRNVPTAFTKEAEEIPVSKEQIAFLFQDGRFSDAEKTSGTENVSGTGNASGAENVSGMKNVSEAENVSGTGKTAEEYWEQSFAGIGAQAPESVKKAWLEAAEKAGVDGMGVSRNGKLSHLTRMMVQQCVRWHRGESGGNLLGNSVQSAIRAAERALYELEHPLEPGRSMSPEKRRNMAKEKHFYMEFLNRLQGLQGEGA